MCIFIFAYLVWCFVYCATSAIYSASSANNYVLDPHTPSLSSGMVVATEEVQEQREQAVKVKVKRGEGKGREGEMVI